MSSFKLSQPQEQVLRRLLHMEYTPTELAQEIGCPQSAIKRAMDAGCPVRQEGKYTYIVGDAFARWYKSLPKKPKAHLKNPDDAYCLRCRKVQRMTDVELLPNSTGVLLAQGICAVCGATINRFVKESE